MRSCTLLPATRSLQRCAAVAHLDDPWARAGSPPSLTPPSRAVAPVLSTVEAGCLVAGIDWLSRDIRRLRRGAETRAASVRRRARRYSVHTGYVRAYTCVRACAPMQVRGKILDARMRAKPSGVCGAAAPVTRRGARRCSCGSGTGGLVTDGTPETRPRAAAGMAPEAARRPRESAWGRRQRQPRTRHGSAYAPNWPARVQCLPYGCAAPIWWQASPPSSLRLVASSARRRSRAVGRQLRASSQSQRGLCRVEPPLLSMLLC